MMLQLFEIAEEVKEALASNRPVVALESTVITHGLPYPENLSLARDMEVEVRGCGAVPATIAVLAGKVMIGTTSAQLEKLATEKEVVKVSSRDFAAAIAKGLTGGTTVAATLVAAHAVGIQVFATGGIGGVHRQAPTDISADLPQLARTPLVVVCAGAKAILDLPATIEYLETAGVPVVGYCTDEFPAFYSIKSGLGVSARADSPIELAAIAKAHWGMGLQSAVLVGNPPPADVALSESEIEEAIDVALQEAFAQKVHGQAVTPFLLARVSQLTGGSSLKANLGLLKNNARVAAMTAVELAKKA